jgi:broad specificity phosphatase PhoE
LREVHFGDWTGLNYDQVQQTFGVSASAWLDQLELAAIPNAENGATYRARIEPILRQIMAGHVGQTVAIFCHGGVTRMILSILLELPFPKTAAFQIDYASVTEVTVGPEHTRIELLNFAPWRHHSPPTA